MARVVVGMIGLGTVGTGVVHLLSQQKNIALKSVAVRDLKKERDVKLKCKLTDRVEEVIEDPEIEILIEVAGGEEPILGHLKQAIERRKHIVTANKEVLAKHGPELFSRARERGVAIFFEASVAGGVPLLSTMHKGLEANQISSVRGILNGTTNFILSSMEQSGATYDAALKRAQELGFAEADPTNDVDGYDVAYKLSILSALAYQRFAKPADIFREGIRCVSDADITQAQHLGYRIKLVGSASRAEKGNGIDVRVHPTLVPLSHPLASVSGSNNGIIVNGDAVGELTMVGPGAGQMPTASAVVGDTINLASALQLPDFASYFQPEIESEWATVNPAADYACPYYLRLSVSDEPGVIGKIGTIFGEHHISILSILQQGVHKDGATIIILTHDVVNKDMEAALQKLHACSFLQKQESCIRIFKSVNGNA